MLEQVQKALKALGLYSGEVDGIAGPLTDKAVRAFQKANGLTVDGVPGPRTWAALFGKDEAEDRSFLKGGEPRPIDELIWHCTATPEGREVSVKEIDQWHKARGWKGIGYHLVVHLDGSVSEGRPIAEIGAHVAGRNTGTVGFVYVGGVDADDRKKAKDTRTPAQKETMLRLTKEAIARFHLRKVSGHSEYANKACPCFNVKAEYGHLLKG